jgi:hypothetical protein
MSNFKDIMVNQDVWNNAVHPKLKTAVINAYNNAFSSFYCPGRVLTDTLRSTLIGGYYNNGYSTVSRLAYGTLAYLCGLFLKNAQIRIIPHYKLVSSSDAETLTIQQMANWVNLANNTLDIIPIALVHIPKGKSYVRKLIDESPDVTRLKPIENLCIESPYHFIRVLKGFGSNGPNSITIFTDQVSERLIQTLFVMLPNMLNLEEIPEDQMYSEEETYNTGIKLMREIFGALYEFYKDNSTELKQSNVDAFKILLNAKTTALVELFDIGKVEITDFASRLANLQNEVATRSLSDQLNTIERAITQYEQALEEYYNSRRMLLVNIHAISKTEPENVQSFLDTIYNTKAIEILSADNTTLRLRITAPFQYFNTTDFEAYENNIHSDYLRMYRDDPVMQSILHKTFVTQEYRLLAQAVIKVSLNTSSYANTPLQFSAQTSLTEYTQLPNPHLYHHDCWSKAKTEMQKNINEKNYELVVMQMVAAVQSINIAEHTSFVYDLLEDMRKYQFQNLMHFMDSTGKVYDYNEMHAHEKQIMEEKTIQTMQAQMTQKPEYTQVEIADDDSNWDDITIYNPNNTEQ